MSGFEIPRSVQLLYEDIQPEQLRYHQRRVALTKEFTFDSAHHLHLYEGKCKSLHGHTYKLIITMSGFVDDIGICVDFGDIKKVYEHTIKARLDHKYLNEVLPPMNTTAENMIVWIWEQIDEEIEYRGWKKHGTRIEELVLYETPTSYATLKREWMEDND
ncbi:6-carboxytetrahydropterin synthase QueD [Aneurinibacillus aneurinilyticus]|uniref:6-carboxy-5,6,7,8-tetrahydropterin synthase n=2 Tax=Aneurinibacillus aneurinilyticus TaxID=1391 RepID=A0A848CWT3_ANEAE|nr:6-carboxytetrahydropterin synthase QueD [Aneurinibacillus aneurinilyticus]ERI08233.1 queuosine biosynthesis protein QueD [Aneurinibacillus aneurinilyticus ATCC 12856]MED0704606.1 6-carboxytetrahydropterin synthase QueD [Aneurinibacillus aneurinilyticus]MED0721538.1 6-carboxytetrahydropterin synthase QueD [Aneurinibacillus aneurinilyticus]MED0734806.1 6-carboxytetrahydropterin synthase QueD [Aneurinibacillus aneurinilyticus]MED0742449.1 6-carboxytetrahydropterin synthase QueD [Aneurinibacill